MIGKLFGLIGALLTYFSIGTMLALVVGLGYLINSGMLTHDKVLKIAAIMEGTDLDAVRAQMLAEREVSQPTQLSLFDEAQARARLSRDLELREQSLRTASAQLRNDQSKLSEESDRYKRVRQLFEKQLADLRESQLAASQESTRLLLENIKPAQAKEQIMLMAATGEMEEAVLLIAAMPVSKQAKVIGEFKTDQEQLLVADIIKRLRSGQPELTVINAAETNLQPTPTP